MDKQEVNITKAIDEKIGEAIDKYIDVDYADDFGAYSTGFQRGVQWAIENRCLFMDCKIEIDKRQELSIKKTEDPYQFKDGDFVVIEGSRPVVFIYKGRRDRDTIFHHCFIASNGDVFYEDWIYAFDGVMRMAGPFEKKRLIKALADSGKRWNPDTFELEDIEDTPVGKL